MSAIPAPPRLARRLLAHALPADAVEHITAELGEVFEQIHQDEGPSRARRWYWREALSFAGGFTIERVRERAQGGSRRAALQGNRRSPVRGLLESWTSDVTQAARRLRRTPGFSLITLTTLALAIGASTAIFAVVDAVLIDPIGLPNADRLVSIRGTAPGSDLPAEFATGPEFYVTYRDEADLLESIAMWQPAQTTVRSETRVDRLFVSAATSSLFETLDVRPAIGRPFSAEDDKAGANVIIISHWLWTTWFGGDPGVIGRTVEAAGTQRRVVGVMPPDFRFPDARTALWVRGSILDESRITPGRLGFHLVARIQPGATVEDVRMQLARVAGRIPQRFGGDTRYAKLLEQYRPVVRTLEEDAVRNVARPLWIVLATAVIVYLIACANLANLFVVRSESRRRDLAVRNALGAGRGGLIRSQMAEALLLSCTGGALGALLAWSGAPLLVSLAPEEIPNLDLVRLSPLTILFAVTLSMLAACAFGLIPAVRFSRPQSIGDLKQAGRIGSAGGGLLRQTLVILQTASALVLLVGAGLLARSFWQLSHVPLGYETDGIFTFQVAPQRPALNDGPSFAAFHQGLMQRIASMPGVERVGLINELPLDEGANRARFATEAMAQSGSNGALSPFSAVGGDYFGVMGIPLVSGRLFENADHQLGAGKILVSRAAADRFWPNENPLGKRLRFGPDAASTAWHTVVGVVGDVRIRDFRQAAPDPMIYLPMVGPQPRSWGVGSPAYVVRSARAEDLAPEIRAVLREYAPEAPMYRIFTMDALAGRALATLSFMTVLMLLASGLALVLGAVGLYGVLSCVVSQRTREIAVRIALGAETSAVRRMVVVQGGTVAVVGVVIGIAAALASAGVLRSLLFGVETFDALTFAGMSLLMLAVAAAASYVPAYRASAVDPIQALRRE